MPDILIDVSNVNVGHLFGDFDVNLKLIEKELGVSIFSRGGSLKITGDEGAVTLCERVIKILCQEVENGKPISEQKIIYTISLATEGNEEKLKDATDSDCVCVTSKGKPIRSKTLGQKKYIEEMNKNSIVFGIGPAGTGKTYLAVAKAVTAFRKKEVSRIIITRPAVEAGEKLGFLPGDLQNKVDPYLRPLYDALYDMIGIESYNNYVEKGAIEVAPLAYMRGRTLDNAYIILDEAQNTTPEQMKMFLTRIGFGSKAIITGDITQIDLPDGKRSGLVEAMKVLSGIEDIAFCTFSHKDVVRHPLVMKIIQAYEKHDKTVAHNREKRKNTKGGRS